MITTVLVIDDDPVLRRLMTKLLIADGHLVRTASSGEEALTHIESAPPPNAVVCDVVMPGISGHEVMTHIRADARWAKVPLLALTAQAGDAERDGALRSGADLFMNKPFSSFELIAAIRELLALRVAA